MKVKNFLIHKYKKIRTNSNLIIDRKIIILIWFNQNPCGGWLF